MEEYLPTVREIDGVLILDDPQAAAVIRAIEKLNCQITYDAQLERIQYFRLRANLQPPNSVVIVILNVNDPMGAALGDVLMPGNDAQWDAIRASGQVPYARGLASRHYMQDLVQSVDGVEAEKMLRIDDRTPVMIMDRGVLAVF